MASAAAASVAVTEATAEAVSSVASPILGSFLAWNCIHGTDHRTYIHSNTSSNCSPSSAARWAQATVAEVAERTAVESYPQRTFHTSFCIDSAVRRNCRRHTIQRPEG